VESVIYAVSFDFTFKSTLLQHKKTLTF